MRMFYAIIFRLRCKSPKLYIFSVWIMDQSRKNSEEQENKEASLETVCNQYKMFLEYIYGLKPPLLRTQLSELLYPLYVHLFLLLLRQNKCSKYAQEFLEKFHFIAINKPQEIKIMRNSSTTTEVICRSQFKSYKRGSIGIKYTKSNYDHLQKWLECNQPFIISKLLKENFHTEILNERLGKADPVIPPKVKARSEKDMTLDELIISRKIPPDSEIADESNEESCQEVPKVEELDDISYVTSGSETSDNEELSNTKVDELSAATSNAIECNKTPDAEKQSNMDIDDVPIATPMTNGIKISGTEKLNNVETNYLSTEVTIANGSQWDDKSLTSEECWLIVEDDSKSIDSNFDIVKKISKAEGISFSVATPHKRRINGQSNDFYLGFQGSSPETEGVVDDTCLRSCNGVVDKVCLPPCNGVNYSSNSTFQHGNFTLRNCKISIPRIDEVKGMFQKNSSRYLEPMPIISPLHIRPLPPERKSVNYSSNSTFQHGNFTLRNCKISIPRIDEVKGMFQKNSSHYLEPMPIISPLHIRPLPPERKRKYSLETNGTATEVEHKKPYQFWNGVVDSSNTLSNSFDDSSSSFEIDKSVTEIEESSNQFKSVMEKAMPRVESFSFFKGISKVPSSPMHEDCGANCVSSILEKDMDDNAVPCSPAIPTQKVNEDRWKGCANCLVKKAFTSGLDNPSDEMQSTEDEENLTNKHTKKLLKAICLLDPEENETSFENLLSNERLCLSPSKVNENCELIGILEKCKLQSNESPFIPTQVPPIRVLNIESDENLHCSVIAKDLSYVACAFEKSMYIWRCMEKIPKKYYLSTKYMELSKRNAFVPKTERIGGVSASPQMPYSGSLHCLACNPLTNTFLLGSESTIERWCPMKNQCLSTYKCHTDQVNNIFFRPNSSNFISTSMDKRAIVWDFETSIPKCLFSHKDAVKLATVHPKCPYLVTATAREIHLWTEGSPLPQSLGKDYTADITGIAFSPSGDHLASCDKSGLVSVWDMNKRQMFNSFSVTKKGVGNLCYNCSVENTVLATAGLDNTLRLYSGGNSSNAAQQRIPIFTAECGNSSTLNSIQFSNTGELVEVTHTLKNRYEKYPKLLS